MTIFAKKLSRMKTKGIYYFVHGAYFLAKIGNLDCEWICIYSQNHRVFKYILFCKY